MIPRLYLPPDSGATTDPTLTGASLPLSKEQSHYLARVLRLEEGAALVVFDGCGGEWEATFLPPATAHIGTPTGRNPESPLDLTLACAIGKGDRFDWVLQKATEAGVTRIVPLLTRRTQVKIEAGQKEERKLERWQAIVMEAAEQSERTVIPEIAPPITPSRLDLSIPTLVAFERGGRPMEQLLADDDILSPHVRAHAGANASEGIGVSEAPRGLLIHHYQVDADGLITDANLIIATGHNNLAMNRGVYQVAKRFIRDGRLEEGVLNRVEAVIRAFDPCLSCSTHAVGRMPLEVELVDAEGRIVDRLVRDGS